MNNIFINKSVWETFSETQMNEYIGEVFNYYKNNGFPYFNTDKQHRDNEYTKLSRYNREFLISDKNIIKQTMHGLGLANSYFPHMFSVRCNGCITPTEAFIDDCMFKKVITKRIKLGSNISDNGIRKMIKMFTGVQSVSNFRPTAAAAIYDLFGKDKIVWDMSCGYGGRLFGAIISGVKQYIGTEPCKATFNGLQEICDNFKPEFKNTIYMSGSEDFIPEKNSLDLCFTSPPYFNTEKYSDEETQSCIKFPDINMWVDGFLKKTIKNCYTGLKNGGYLIINIANTKNAGLEDITLRICEQEGFIYSSTLFLSLSSYSKKTSFKYEPVFVFKK